MSVDFSPSCLLAVSPSPPSVNGISGVPQTTGMCPVSAGPRPVPIKGRRLRCPVLADREERIPGLWSKENLALWRLQDSGGSSLLAWDHFYFGKMTSVWGLLPCLGKRGAMEPPSNVEPGESGVQIPCHSSLTFLNLPPLERRDAP